jgi:hypothetical protein
MTQPLNREQWLAACATLAQTYERTMNAYADLLAMLEEVADYLDRYADVIDGDDGQPEANDAMRLRSDVLAAIAKARGAA